MALAGHAAACHREVGPGRGPRRPRHRPNASVGHAPRGRPVGDVGHQAQAVGAVAFHRCQVLLQIHGSLADMLTSTSVAVRCVHGRLKARFWSTVRRGAMPRPGRFRPEGPIRQSVAARMRVGPLSLALCSMPGAAFRAFVARWPRCCAPLWWHTEDSDVPKSALVGTCIGSACSAAARGSVVALRRRPRVGAGCFSSAAHRATTTRRSPLVLRACGAASTAPCSAGVGFMGVGLPQQAAEVAGRRVARWLAMVCSAGRVWPCAQSLLAKMSNTHPHTQSRWVRSSPQQLALLQI